MLLVAFCFGALIEGIAGFGAPVAITASMLAGLGFEPVTAAVLSLVANTAPVAFGSLGIPVVTLGGLHRADSRPRRPVHHAGALGDGRTPAAVLLGADPGLPRRAAGRLAAAWSSVLPAVLTAGVSFALVQFVVSNYIGPELTDTLAVARLARPRWRCCCGCGGHAATMPHAATAARQPRRPRTTAPAASRARSAPTPSSSSSCSIGQVGNFARPAGRCRRRANVTALLRCGQAGNALCPDPWVTVSAARPRAQAVRFPVWDLAVARVVRVVEGEARVPLVRREPPVVRALDALPADLPARLPRHRPGTLVLFAARRRVRADAGARRAALARSASPSANTLAQLRLPIVTIAFILSIATVMNYSGMTSSMALALAATGWLFPFFSAFLGMLGVFLTGSDTSSNTLFGPLQATTAQVSGLDPILMAATNSSGGVMGKMISPQNLSVGRGRRRGGRQRGTASSAACIGHSLVLTALMGLLAMLQAYVF